MNSKKDFKACSSNNKLFKSMKKVDDIDRNKQHFQPQTSTNQNNVHAHKYLVNSVASYYESFACNSNK